MFAKALDFLLIAAMIVYLSIFVWIPRISGLGISRPNNNFPSPSVPVSRLSSPRRGKTVPPLRAQLNPRAAYCPYCGNRLGGESGARRQKRKVEGGKEDHRCLFGVYLLEFPTPMHGGQRTCRGFRGRGKADGGGYSRTLSFPPDSPPVFYRRPSSPGPRILLPRDGLPSPPSSGWSRWGRRRRILRIRCTFCNRSPRSH